MCVATFDNDMIVRFNESARGGGGGLGGPDSNRNGWLGTS